MKYIYEFIGTFFLVLTVGLSVLGPVSAGPFAPLAIASVLAVMIYAGAHVSGGHYNPAVSLAAYLRGRLVLNDLVSYWIAQLLAAVVAAYLSIYFKGAPHGMPLVLNVSKAFIGEFLFTFALCYVVLNVATAKATQGNSYFGFAIGFTVLAGSYAVGAVSGAAFNPAVALGTTLMNLSVWQNLWVYFAANLLGGVASAAVFKAAHENE